MSTGNRDLKDDILLNDLVVDGQRNLLHAIDVIVWRMDSSTFAVQYAAGATDRLGFELDEWVARADFFASMLHPEDRDGILKLLREVAADGRERHAVHRVFARDGELRWYRTGMIGVRRPDGTLRELVGVMLDITERFSTESTMRTSDASLRRVLEQLPAIVFTTDCSLRFTSGVGAGLAELGLRPDSVLTGVAVHEYLQLNNPDDPRLAPFRRALEGDAVLFEMEWHGRVFETRVEPLRGPGDEIVGTLAVSHNVTKRKEAENALRLLADASAALAESLDYDETLAKVARLAVPVLADWCLVGAVEEGLMRPLALAHVDAAKEPLIAQLRPAPLEDLGDIGRVVRDGRPLLVPDVTEMMLVPGGPIPLPPGDTALKVVALLLELGLRSYMAVPLSSRGRTVGAMVFGRASGARRYGPADLGVAQELGRRCATAIDNALLYRTSQEAIRTRDEFLSVASHELRTPLTSMLLRLEALEKSTFNGRPIDVSSLQGSLNVLLRQARRLASLVEQLLDVSRIRSGRLELALEELDLWDVLRDVATRLEADLSRAGCALSYTPGASIVGRWDRTRIEQVVTNLLSNAIKFARGKPIDIDIDADPSRARIVVRDRGPGISDADQKRIFERFERGVSSRHVGGLGLGLYITRQIVEAHGGTVKVASAPGGGATFTVELPRRPSV